MLKKNWKVLAIVLSVILILMSCSGTAYLYRQVRSFQTVVGPQGPAGPAGQSVKGDKGDKGDTGPQGPAGINGKDADPAVVLALMKSDPVFLKAVKQALGAPTLVNPYMLAYQDSLEYKVPVDLSVPADLLKGFDPVPSLVKTDFVFPNDYKVQVPPAPVDVSSWYCFPQDYSMSDQFNPGCKALQLAGKLPWSKPVAGYNDGNNWSSDSPDGWSADDIQAFNWRVITGYQVCHPAVGCIKDPDGGAVELLIVNFLDSDEVWNVRNQSAIFVDSGFIGYGVMWDLSGSTYDVGKGIADIRNHYLYNLSQPVSPSDNHLRGQCGDSGLCETVTHVTVARVWDRPELGIKFSHFELLSYGQWVRP